MDSYYGNSALYSFIHDHRQAIFLDRNLKYLFDGFGFNDHGNHRKSRTNVAGESGGRKLATRPSTPSSLSSPARHASSMTQKRRRVSIDSVCDALAANLTSKSNADMIMSMILLNNAVMPKHPVVVSPLMKLEVTGIMRLAKNSRRQIRRPQNLQKLYCSCELQIHRTKVSATGKQKKRLIYQSTEMCWLVPNMAKDGNEKRDRVHGNRSSKTNGQSMSSSSLQDSEPVISLQMNEPFYIKADLLAAAVDSGSSSLSSLATKQSTFSIKLTIRNTVAKSDRAWPFSIAAVVAAEAASGPATVKSSIPTPVSTALRLRSQRNTTQSPSASSSSPLSSLVHDINNKELIYISDCDSDDNQQLKQQQNDDNCSDHDDDDDDRVELWAELDVDLFQLPELNFVIPGQVYKPGGAQKLKNNSGIGLSVEMGWGMINTDNADDDDNDVKYNDDNDNDDGNGNDVSHSSRGVQESHKDTSANDKGVIVSSSLSTPETRGGLTRFHMMVGKVGKRKMTCIMAGYVCPWCNKDYKFLERLQFHFTTCHGLFSFRLYKQRQDESKSQNLDVEVSLATEEIFHDRAGNHAVDSQLLQWLKPTRDFHLMNFLRGDGSWLEDGRNALDLDKSFNFFSLLSSSNSVARASPSVGMSPLRAFPDNTGQDGASLRPPPWASIQAVPDFPAKISRKFPVPFISGVTLYTTKAKRKMEPEEVLSESEDDVDEEWLIHKHEEIIDDFEDVLPNEKRYIKLWDRHIFEEKPQSYKHVADSLVRFCRKHKIMLQDKAMSLELWKHGLNLITYGIIKPGLLFACMRYLKDTEADQNLDGLNQIDEHALNNENDMNDMNVG
ncbi:hypothetical protein V1514DRAFT_325892 [Lipomyces japonicus]|uniref:uncharacterized protein n=1 Tax=Lipomyces japonicus TaxID=56871 RepID=UPI0034CF363E